MWKNLYVKGAIGSENGIVLEDEEYADSCRITLEKCPRYYAITCGVYGAMAHTVFCDFDNCKNIYNAMKSELQAFIDRDTTEDEEIRFYEEFTSRF